MAVAMPTDYRFKDLTGQRFGRWAAEFEKSWKAANS